MDNNMVSFKKVDRHDLTLPLYDDDVDMSYYKIEFENVAFADDAD